MKKWYELWYCDRCGNENTLILGQSNKPIHTTCQCGKLHFNNIEFTITDSGAIIEYE